MSNIFPFRADYINSPTVRQFLKFGVVGVLNTIIDFGVFCILVYKLHFPVLPSHMASFTCAVINSYLWNALWTFRGTGALLVPSKIIRFIGVAIAIMALSSALILVFDHFMSAFLAKIVVIGFTIILGYLGNRLIVFKTKN